VEKAENHPWVATIRNGLFEAIFYDVFRRVPFLKLWPSLIRPANVVAQRQKQFANSRVRVERRMQQTNDRDDFFSHLLSEKATDLTPDYLTAQANTLIIAGSETTATFLAGQCNQFLSRIN
jgi:cytochrome P450